MNFDLDVGRRNTACAKWSHYGPDVLPMWVADMDFKSPEPVLQAMRERLEHGVFGYEPPSANVSNTICEWLERRHQWKVTPADIIYMPGLVSGLNVVSRAVGHIGDSAIVLSPVYGPFMSAPPNQGLTVTKVELKRADQGEHVNYEIDFDAFERAFTSRTALFIHCHPHNPIGREFSEDENRKLAEICLKKNAVICSDEIWADLMLDGTKHKPVAAISPEIADRTITLMAPSKTFNIPGLGFSFAIVQNPQLRTRINNAKDGIIPGLNAMGITAAQAAFSKCDGWLDELQAYLTENRNVMLDYMAENMPDIKTTLPNSTYLGWLDCRNANIPGGARNAYDFFLKQAKVGFSGGEGFGPGGEGFVRINFGCPRPQMMEALDRMRNALRSV